MRNFYIWIIIFLAIMIFEFVGKAARKRKQQSDTSIDSTTAAERSVYDQGGESGGYGDDDEYDYEYNDLGHGDFSEPQSREIWGHAQERSYSGRTAGSPSDMFPKRNSLNKSKGNKLFS